MAKMNISMDDWVMTEIVMPSTRGNRSARIQELIIKGSMYEQQKRANPQEGPLNAVCRAFAGNSLSSPSLALAAL